MAETLPEILDATRASNQFLIVITFANSPSRGYGRAVEFAKQAQRYAENKNGKDVLHIAAFAKTHAQAAIALSLADLVAKWQGTQSYAGGAFIQQPYYISEILRCYLQSAANDNYRAHCHTVIDDPERSEWGRGSERITITLGADSEISDQHAQKVNKYLFPCRLLRPYFKFERAHPSNIVEQIKFSAIRKGCDWCPNFSAEEFRKLNINTSNPMA